MKIISSRIDIATNTEIKDMKVDFKEKPTFPDETEDT